MLFVPYVLYASRNLLFQRNECTYYNAAPINVIAALFPSLLFFHEVGRSDEELAIFSKIQQLRNSYIHYDVLQYVLYKRTRIRSKKSVHYSVPGKACNISTIINHSQAFQ